jgi:hypothetical protein
VWADLATAHREAKLGFAVAGLEASRSGIDNAAEGEVAVVVGEAADETVAPCQPPAAGECRDAAGETGGELPVGGDGFEGGERIEGDALGREE